MRNICAIGDSMVDAVGRSSVTDSTQWLYKLLQNLGEASITPTAYSPPDTPTTPNNKLLGTNWTAYNAGIGGQTSTQILARFDTDVFPTAEFVVIHAGHNDITAGTTVSTITSNIAAMVTKAKAMGATPILSTIPPYNGGTATMKNAVDSVNAYIAGTGELCADWYGALVTDAGNRESSYETDNIHPGAAGQTLMAAEFDYGWFVAYDLDVVLFTQYDLDVFLSEVVSNTSRRRFASLEPFAPSRL